jgi:hypothetical protein
LNPSAFTTTQILIALAIVAVVVGAILVFFLQKRRTQRLNTKFGESEYSRAVTERGGGRREAEAELDRRSERVQSFHLRPLSSPDRARFVSTWTKVQAHFIDGPASAVTEADQLLADVMTTRGYPVSDFEQRAADISVDHPQVTVNYRAAHAIALRQISGKATTEDLRQALIHYRALFEDMVGEPKEMALTA